MPTANELYLKYRGNENHRHTLIPAGTRNNIIVNNSNFLPIVEGANYVLYQNSNASGAVRIAFNDTDLATGAGFTIPINTPPRMIKLPVNSTIRVRATVAGFTARLQNFYRII